MFQQPSYIENVSVRLSEVLADIGVDERIVTKRRRTCLLLEYMRTISLANLDNINSSSYYFGSQSEGTTTIGLASDVDSLQCANSFNVIQDWSDWEPGVANYLMIQGETVSHCYCLLQRLGDDAPLPCKDIPNEHYLRDRKGRILLRNTFVSVAAFAYEEAVRHGPAYAQQGRPGMTDADNVIAFPCKSWPLKGSRWYDWEDVGQWPTDDMWRYCRNSRCFVVAVGSKGSENEELEWRVSTSLAERCLMFSLNITQIRCYILMKMVLKTFFRKPQFEDTISSFMCKTVLFHCIENTQANIWRENNLLVCLSICLFALYNSILNESCPHFIIPGNNLMRGKIPPAVKYDILEILRYIINSEGTALLGIECDAIGLRLKIKLVNLFTFKLSDIVSGSLLQTSAHAIDGHIKFLLFLVTNSSYEEALQILLKYIFNLSIFSNQCQGVDKTACCLLSPWICTILGSVLASLNIHLYNTISTEALTWISLGLKSDVSSSKLKLASKFYCIGDIQRTDIVLRDTERNYDVNIVEPICKCSRYIKQAPRRGFEVISDNHNEEAASQYVTAFCVRFLPCEINCIPTELRYEMFRSTQEDIAFRGRRDYWMELAVVDSLPYLYFLQYKTYSRLESQQDKQDALSKLVRVIDQEPNLGHRETALNLLGQCMEQEQRARDALLCYLFSLNLRERNNAAKFHICRLLSNIISNQ